MLDLIVIGGGIQGAAIAKEAASRGFDVLVLEQGTIGSGTSRKSTKLIHGGLRYLEQREVGLVKEALQERKALLEDYPDLVHLRRFLVPVYKSSSRSAFKIKTGLRLYNFLSGKGWNVEEIGKDQRQWIGPKADGMKAMFVYEDGQTDDYKLTCRVMDEAKELGAEVQEFARVYQIEHSDAHCIVHWCNEREEPSFQAAEYVINASGPWVNNVLDKVTPTVRKQEIKLVKGTHILVPYVNRPNVCFYLEAPQDKRPIFVTPWWEDQVLVGTTEVEWEGDPSMVTPSDNEVEYLVEAYNHYFKRDIDVEHVSSFAGLRVLPKDAGKLGSLSREVSFLTESDKSARLLTVYGGKLTVHRSTARKALDKLRLKQKV